MQKLEVRRKKLEVRGMAEEELGEKLDVRGKMLGLVLLLSSNFSLLSSPPPPNMALIIKYNKNAEAIWNARLTI